MSKANESDPKPFILSSTFDSVLSSLFNAVPEGVLIMDRNLDVVYINQRMRDLWNYPLGMSNEEAQRVALSLVNHPKEFERRIGEIISSEDIISQEHIYLKDGRVYSRCSKPLIIDDQYEGRVWTYRNITDRIYSSNLLENLVEHAPNGIALIDPNGSFVHANQAWANMLGYSVQELLNTSFAHHTHPEDIAKSYDVFQQVNSGEIAKGSLEKRYIRKDTSIIDVLVHISMLPKQTDHEVLYLAQIVDLTQLKKAEHALFQSQKLESIGILAGGIAHDFNNLLLAIKTQVEVALKKQANGINVNGHLGKIKASTQNAAYLTEQLLAYSGRRKFKVEDLNINDEIKNNLSIFNLAIPKNISLAQKLDAHLPRIAAEKGQIQQILLNIIINAAEAMNNQPGKINISTSLERFSGSQPLDGGRFVLEPVIQGPHVLISVKDSGAGMDKETMDQIFDPFFTTKFTGRGLGLAAVLGILRGHKGALHVISQEGAGTTFNIYFPASAHLPYSASFEPFKAQTNNQSDGMENNKAILLVDDDDDVREALIDLFELENINLICASDGSEGIEKLIANKDEIVLTLLDLSMPGLSSPETYSQLKDIKPDLPIMLCSGYSDHEINEAFEGKEIEGFIAKPFEISHLIETVQKFTHPLDL